MTNLEVAGYFFDGLIKSGIYSPQSTYLNFPTIAVLKTRFSATMPLFLNSTEAVLKSFDERGDIQEIYEKSYITNYCDYYNEIKNEHLEGFEKYPCSEVFKNYQNYVRCILE